MNVERVLEVVVDAEILSGEESREWDSYWKEQSQSPDDGDGLIAKLLDERIITEFHAKALRDGVPGPYRFGPYRVFDRIVVGRLGTIFRAIHEEFNQPVGLKVFSATLKDDPERSIRLARETRIAVQVDHPNVLRTFQVGRVGDIVFLAIEDLQGWTLADRLDEEEIIEPLEACRLIREAALGLAHLHSLEIVHRDIQPANIWLTDDGHAKLMEFGAARDALAAELDRGEDEEDITSMQMELLGSCDYISAEQAADEHAADARSDVYSLGCVLHRCLTGEVVFPDQNPVRKMARHANESARYVSDVNPDVPKEISDVVVTMLAKNPDERFQKAEDVAWALEQVIEIEEEYQAVAEEISEDFLQWANSCQELDQIGDIPVVVAEPKFIKFAEWLSEHEEEEVA